MPKSLADNLFIYKSVRMSLACLPLLSYIMSHYCGSPVGTWRWASKIRSREGGTGSVWNRQVGEGQAAGQEAARAQKGQGKELGTKRE